MTTEAKIQSLQEKEVQILRQIRSINLRAVIDCTPPHGYIYRPWILEGDPSGLKRPSVAVAVFPNETGGFDLECPETLLAHSPIKEYLRQVTELRISPELARYEEEEYGNSVVIGDAELQRIGAKNLAGAYLPSTVVIFDDLGETERTVYLLCPKDISPSVGLRQIRRQAGYRCGVNGLGF